MRAFISSRFQCQIAQQLHLILYTADKRVFLIGDCIKDLITKDPRISAAFEPRTEVLQLFYRADAGYLLAAIALALI
jgi:hypothetical protein